MMRRIRATIAIVATAGVTLIVNCGNGSEVLQPVAKNIPPGGYSIDGVTAIAGVPRSGVMVSAYDTGYIPIWTFNGQAVHTVSDSAGAFSLLLTKGTLYSLLCIDTSSKSGSFIGSMPKDTDTSLGTLSLAPLGSITGKLYGDSVSGHAFNVYLKGTPFYTTAGSNGEFVLVGVPRGTYAVIASEHIVEKSSNYVPMPPVSGFKEMAVESGKTTIDSLHIQ